MKSSSAEAERKEWETISSETCFQDAHLSVVDEKVRSPAGEKARSWMTVRRKAAVVIAPMTAEGKLVLIRQERIPIRATIWEVPGGQIDIVAGVGDPGARRRRGEQPQSSGVTDPGYNAAIAEEVALRELREETGYELSANGKLVPLGQFFSSPGFTDERAYFFLAAPVELSAAGHAHEDSESILDCRAFSPKEIAGMIARDEIRDANTLGICAKLAARGLMKFDG